MSCFNSASVEAGIAAAIGTRSFLSNCYRVWHRTDPTTGCYVADRYGRIGFLASFLRTEYNLQGRRRSERTSQPLGE